MQRDGADERHEQLAERAAGDAQGVAEGREEHVPGLVEQDHREMQDRRRIGHPAEQHRRAPDGDQRERGEAAEPDAARHVPRNVEETFAQRHGVPPPARPMAARSSRASAVHGEQDAIGGRRVPAVAPASR